MLNTKNARQAIEALKRDKQYFDHLREVGYYPHKGQKPIINILNNSGVKYFFMQCARNFGKSTTDAIDAVWHAGRTPRAKVYIIPPFRTLAEEIYLQSGIIDAIIPPDWRLPGSDGYNASQLRWRLKNGAYIKLDGADNEAAVRGYKPTRLYADEFQDWKKRVWQAMQPNLLAHDATVVFSGTPPPVENVYTEMADFIKQKMLEKNPRYFWVKRTIYDNDRIARELIEELRQGFEMRGEMDVWEREYMATFVKGGARYVFPQFLADDSLDGHVRPVTWMIERISQDLKHVNFYTVSDPSGTRHATLFIAYNKATAEAFVLDEIVETDAQKLSCGQLSVRVKASELKYFNGAYESPFRIYDEAAKLYAIEMADYQLYFAPTQKKQNQKSNNISLVRDALINKKLFVASHCRNTISDLKTYHTDENGQIVKELDDCCDCVLYFYAESGYTFRITPLHLTSNDVILVREGIIKPSHDSKYWTPPDHDGIDPEELENDLWN